MNSLSQFAWLNLIYISGKIWFWWAKESTNEIELKAKNSTESCKICWKIKTFLKKNMDRRTKISFLWLSDSIIGSYSLALLSKLDSQSWSTLFTLVYIPSKLGITPLLALLRPQDFEKILMEVTACGYDSRQNENKVERKRSLIDFCKWQICKRKYSFIEMKIALQCSYVISIS